MNKKVWDWIKQHNNLIKAVLMSLVPLLAAALMCAVNGKTIGQLSLITSEWNDELFYYKQVEAIVTHGFPQGYFGFNESHAQYLSFAAWSPVLVFPWILWGLLFGWNLMSPIYCNIFMMMLAVFVFVLLTKPGKKQMSILAVLYLAGLFLNRYMLSCMPEALCASMAVIYLAVCYSYRTKEKKYQLVILFSMVFLMTLMRPYLLMFLLFPAYYSIKKYGFKGWIPTGVTLLASFGVYLWINKALSAAYFTPLFKTDWLRSFQSSGLFGGMIYTLRAIKQQAATLITMLRDGILYGFPAGVLYIQFLLVTVLLGIQVLAERKKEKKQTAQNFLLLYCLGMLAAILLMYKMLEGSRHLVIFITMGIFAISMMETKFYKKAVVTVLVFLISYQKLPVSLFYYQLPYQVETKEQDYVYWEETFREKLTLNEQEIPNFDNVVIWTLKDVAGEEEKLTEWQMLYALPEGFGISCCEPEYVKEQFEQLQAKYIAVVPGGSIEAMCVSGGRQLIGSSQGVAVYQLR